MKRICLFLLAAVLLISNAAGEDRSEEILEWIQWQTEGLGLDIEEDIGCEWDGYTECIEVPDDADFWWQNLGDFALDSFADSYSVDSHSLYYAVQEGVLFSKDMTILYRYPPMKTGWYYQVPSTVVRIEAMAFTENYYLQEVVIPDSVAAIGDDTFNRSRIRKIHLPESIEELDVEAFTWCPCLEEMIVKQGSYCWIEFENAREYIDFFEIIKAY